MPPHPRLPIVGDEIPVRDALAVASRDGHGPHRARTGEAARAADGRRPGPRRAGENPVIGRLRAAVRRPVLAACALPLPTAALAASAAFLAVRLAPFALFFAIVALGLYVTGWIAPPRRRH